MLDKLLQKILPDNMRTLVKNSLRSSFDIEKRIYFSQFGEDAVLQSYYMEKAYRAHPPQSWRESLNPKIENGFYVDIGAYEPKKFSNTYWFYRKGWSGINIDAFPGSMIQFNRLRPRDINIEALISDSNEELDFYTWGESCGVNTLDPDYAKEWELKLDQSPKLFRLHPQRLDDILNKHLPVDRSISFMNIDTEGHEIEVLRSNNWERYRPELLVIELLMNDIERILNSELALFMANIGYSLYSWVKPTTIWLRN